ncbi:MAG: hypothetical protein ACXVHW_04670 [Methanobacterium sp.]
MPVPVPASKTMNLNPSSMAFFIFEIISSCPSLGFSKGKLSIIELSIRGFLLLSISLSSLEIPVALLSFALFN